MSSQGEGVVKPAGRGMDLGMPLKEELMLW